MASTLFYRLSVDGPAIPAVGPVLLVANHPNSLLDPVVVAGTVGRPVRFLAKAPLFAQPVVGRIIRAAGAIPVYRRQDDPAAMGRNADVLRTVVAELAAGAAVGIFPEGISHSAPSLAELRTGAARIALQTGARTGGSFPLVPVGLVPERKERFRSRLHVVLGSPVSWEDLAGAGEDDRDAVRTLTARIEAGLRGVTLNLERWEDRPLVEAAESIWSVGRSAAPGPAEQVRRLDVTTRILAFVRRGGEHRWEALTRDLATHVHHLRALRLTPSTLGADVGTGAALRWSAARLYLLGPPALALALLEYVIFRLPYRATELSVARLRPARDRASTYRLAAGTMLHSAWTLALAAGALLAWGPWAGLAALVGLPLLAVTGWWIRERWRWAIGDARRFFTLRSHRRLVESLRVEQERIRGELDALYDVWQQKEADARR